MGIECAFGTSEGVGGVMEEGNEIEKGDLWVWGRLAKCLTDECVGGGAQGTGARV
jgi:hypothetical protein